MVDISAYKVGVVLDLEDQSSKGGKTLKICRINIGNPDASPVTIVTSAPNVRQGSRVVVAPEGSSIINDEGDEITLKKTSVGGHMSEGMICDGKMLGWAGGSVGVAVQMPEHFEIGSAPPSSKPRPQGAGGEEEAASAGPVEDGLYERKLSKEEKKRLAKEKREARKAKKGGGD